MTQLADQSTQSESQHDRRQLTEAWSAVTDSLATFGSTAAATGSPLDSAEGVRHALRLFGYLAEMNIERQDVLRPELFTLMSPMRKFWGDGIDVDYWTAMIDPNETYRIHGNRGTVPYVAVLANRVGASGTDRVADNIVIDDKVCDADGNFEIFIAQELEGRNGIRLDERCFDVVVRVYHKTRSAEIDPVLHIERLGPPPGARPDLDTAWLAQRLTKLARGMDVSLRRSLQLIETLSQSPNEIRVTSEQRGWGDFYGTSSNQYVAGWWSLKDATAVDITFTIPDCTYFGVMLYNHWFESFEYRDHTVNLNDAHFERNDDGTVTIRIGGVEGDRNRLNPCNHTEGILLARCLEPAEDVTSASCGDHSMTDEVDLPLAGVRVVEIGQLIAIPSAGQQLSDLGAEVIKLEPPGGEPARQIDADYARGIFYGYNRGKRSICLDLKDSADLQRARDLIASSDILLHNLRPGTLDRLGFSSAELQLLRPEIIAVSVSGYGAEGPSATRAGLDIAAQAESGLMSVTGEADSPPQRVGAPVIDHATSYVVAQAALAALLRRERTGKGSSVRVSLLDVAIHLQTANWIEWQVSGKPMSRKGNGQPSVAPAADVFRAADGELVISGYQPRAWIELCKAIDLPELADDPRFTTNALRVENRVDLVATIEKQLCHRSAAEAVEHLTAAGVVAALVRDYDQVIRADDVVANRTFIPGTNEHGEQYLTPAMPYRAEPPMARTELSQVPALNEWTTSTR